MKSLGTPAVIEQWLRNNIEDYMNSLGELDSIEVIETLQKTFNMAPKDAESALEYFLEDNGL